MLDRVTAGIPDAERGFRLVFSASPFAEQQATFTWLRADPVGGRLTGREMLMFSK